MASISPNMEIFNFELEEKVNHQYSAEFHGDPDSNSLKGLKHVKDSSIVLWLSRDSLNFTTHVSLFMYQSVDVLEVDIDNDEAGSINLSDYA